MNCRQVREEAVGRSELSRGARQHVEGCGECQAFYADIEVIDAACRVPVDSPAFLRTRTMARCAELLRERTVAGQLTAWQRWRRRLDSPRFVAAAAVSGIAVLIAVTAVQIANAQDDASSLPLKLTVFQLAAQNVFTALLLPPLIFFRGRAAGTATGAMKTGE